MRLLFPILAVSAVLTSCGRIPIPLLPITPPISPVLRFSTDESPGGRPFTAQCTAIEVSESVSAFRYRVTETDGIERLAVELREVGDFSRPTSIQASCFQGDVVTGMTVANVHRKLRFSPGPNLENHIFVSSCGLPVVQSAQIISKTGNCPPNIAVR